jgi:hypothetical protein
MKLLASGFNKAAATWRYNFPEETSVVSHVPFLKKPVSSRMCHSSESKRAILVDGYEETALGRGDLRVGSHRLDGIDREKAHCERRR